MESTRWRWRRRRPTGGDVGWVLRLLWRTPSSRWLTLVSFALTVGWVAALIDPGLERGMKMPLEVALPMLVAGLMAFAIAIAAESGGTS